MKTLVKIIAVLLPLITFSPLCAQVQWRADIHLGNAPPPPPREVIVERPYPDAIWMPGYYNYVGYRYVWTPGFWRHPHYWIPPGHRFARGWEREERDERFERREHERRDWNDQGNRGR